MVVQNADRAVQNAKSYGTCTPGYCLKYTRTWLEIASHEEDAISAWRNAKHKHPGDKTPPRGAPVFWDIGTHGHIALALDKDTGRSTDTPSSGNVGTQPGTWWNDHWGAHYLGWTEDLNGVHIPYLKDGGTPDSPWASGNVYVEKLHEGQHDSDSVRRLTYRLIHHKDMPGSHKPTAVHGNYADDTLEAVRFWQRNIVPYINGPIDGTSMSNPQANALFGDKYEVHNK